MQQADLQGSFMGIVNGILVGQYVSNMNKKGTSYPRTFTVYTIAEDESDVEITYSMST